MAFVDVATKASVGVGGDNVVGELLLEDAGDEDIEDSGETVEDMVELEDEHSPRSSSSLLLLKSSSSMMIIFSSLISSCSLALLLLSSLVLRGKQHLFLNKFFRFLFGQINKGNGTSEALILIGC